MRALTKILVLGLSVPLLAACAEKKSRYLSAASADGGMLSNQTLQLNASAPRLDFSRGVVVTDNDDAFEQKLAMVEQARESIDLAYYIYSDDYSSSALSLALVQAAERGVRIRLLLDYHANYQHLDRLSMMAARGAAGRGSLSVRLYNRPTRNIVKDAVYLTMGCGDVRPEGQTAGCAAAKFVEIEKLFAAESVGGQSGARLNISNLNVHNSGLFLSGLYAKDANLMALAVSQGQNIDPAALRAEGGEAGEDSKERLRRLGRIYWQARFGGGVRRLEGKIKLALAGVFFGEKIDPVFDTFTGFLPAERETDSDAVRQDWRYLTEFMHHKFLLVDGKVLMLGGRNIEDSYHMAPNELTRKYVFMDTDVQLQLRAGGAGLAAAFSQLWDYRAMVADLAEVREHAPNDVLVAANASAAACEQENPREARQACEEAGLQRFLSRTLDERMNAAYEHMQDNANIYRAHSQRWDRAARGPRFELDASAGVHYLENLPWFTAPGGERSRGYGGRNGFEGEYGKHIHATWLASLRQVCTRSDAANPQQVLLHNAYFFLPSNLMRQFAAMVDGTQDCRHVHVKVLTNSIETTDLNVVNLAARHALKAYAEYYESRRNPERAARVSFHEYLPPGETVPGAAQLSLHSKVMVFGPDIFIGSSNADVRSYMMDSNNGLFIRDAPELVANYSAWVNSFLLDDKRVTDVTEYFRRTPRAQILEQDLSTLGSLLQKYRAERWIEDEQQSAKIAANFVAILDSVYDLTTGMLRGDRRSRSIQEEFNELFKTI